MMASLNIFILNTDRQRIHQHPDFFKLSFTDIG